MIRKFSCLLATVVGATMVFGPTLQASGDELVPSAPMYYTAKTDIKCKLGKTPEKAKNNISLSAASVKKHTTGWVLGRTDVAPAGNVKTDNWTNNRVKRVDRHSLCRKSGKSKTYGKVHRVYVPDRWQHQLKFVNWACGGVGCVVINTHTTKWANCYVDYYKTFKGDDIVVKKRKVCS